MGDDKTDEREAWARVVAGDAASFTEVFDRHHRRVYRHALRTVASPADADDVTAMVFFEAWRKRHNVRVVDGSVLGWLLVTTTNIARNGRRSRRRYEALLARLRPEPVPDHADSVWDAPRVARQRSVVQGAFARLSVSDQQVLVLCVIEELPPAAVATLLRIPAGTVRTRLSRAKSRLRDLVDAAAAGTPAWEEGAL